MPNDIYSKLKENEKVIIENFNSGSGNMTDYIQFIEKVCLEYKIAYEDANDIDKKEIKNSFMRFIIEILHQIEKECEQNKNINISSNINIVLNSVSISLKALSDYYNETNSTHFDYTNETNGIMISAINKIFSYINFNNLKVFIVKLSDNINTSGILTKDEINKFIKPILDRINEEYK